MSSATTLPRVRFFLPISGLLLFVVCLAGCGSGDPFSYVQASGTITYDDGTPIQAPVITLTFIAQNPPTVDEKTFAPKGRANPGPDGKFEYVTSHQFGDGLLPGKHKVLVVATDPRGQAIEGIIPPEYRDPAKTPITVDTADIPFKITVKKPAGGVKPMRNTGPK